MTLQAYYKLNSDSDTSASGVLDATGNGNNCTASGFPWTNGTDTDITYDSNGANFNGSSSVITAASAVLELQEYYAIMMKIKIDAHPPSFQEILTSRAGENHYLLRVRTDGLFDVYDWTGGGTQTNIRSTTDIADGVEHHIAVVRNNTSLTVYVDGVAEATYGSVSGTITYTDNDIYLGSANGGASGFLSAAIKELRIYSGVTTTTTDIQNEMASVFPLKSAGLVLSWLLNSNSNDTNFNVTGKIGQAWSFNGLSNRYIPSPYHAGNTTAATISTWFYAEDISSAFTIYSHGFGNTLYPRVYHQSGTGGLVIQFRVDGSTKSDHVIPYSSFSSKTWHHLLTTFEITGGNAYVKTYVDGVYIGYTTYSSATYFDGGTTDIWLGYDSNTGFMLTGKMDEFSIYSRVLTDGGVSLTEAAGGEVAELYNNGSGSRPTFNSNWNTTNKQIVLQEGDTWRTSNISLGTIHSYFLITTGNKTGEYTILITGDDGETWQTVTEGEKTLFTSNDGTGTRIKITANTATTIASITDSGGKLITPAINCVLEE